MNRSHASPARGTDRARRASRGGPAAATAVVGDAAASPTAMRRRRRPCAVRAQRALHGGAVLLVDVHGGLADGGGFASGGTVLVAAAVILALTLPRTLSMWRRAPLAAFAWLAATAVVAVAAAERLAAVRRLEPFGLHTAWTGAVPTAAAAELTARLRAAAAGVAAGDAEPAWSAIAADGGSVSRAVAIAAARAAVPVEVAVVWSGPFDAASVGGPVAAGVRAYTVRPPAPLDPARLALRLVRRAVVDRPNALELRVAPPDFDALEPAAAAAPTRVAIRVADLEFEVDVPPFATGSGALADADFTAQLPWVPEAAGTAPIAVDWTGADGARATASGRIEVAPARADVLVAGAGAAEFVAALAVQGLAAAVLGDLDAPLDPGRTLVLVDAPPPTLAEPLAAFVDAGGGLVLAGAALPAADEPLASLAPLIALPPVAAPGGGGAPGGEAAGEAPSADGSGAMPPTAGPLPPGPPVPDARTDAPPPSTTPEADPSAPALPPGEDAAAPRGDLGAADPSRGVERAEVERRRIAMVLVVDRSRSMIAAAGEGATRMQLAKRSAKDTALALEPGDELGVVAFGSRAASILELGPLPDDAELERVLARLRAEDGATVLAPGVEAGLTALRASTAPVKSLVVITDADNLGPLDVAAAEATAAEARKAGVTVSLIVITSSVLIAEIRRVAVAGGGQFARSFDGADLPRLVLTEVRRAQGAAGRRVAPDAAPRGGAGGAGGQAAGDGGAAAAPDSPPTEPASAGPPPTEPPPAEREPLGPEPPDPTGAPSEPPADGADQRPADPSPSLATVAVFPVEPSPLTQPWADAGFPELVGEPRVRHQPRAAILLATGAGTPVLALAPFGLGRVAAFAPRWSGDDLVAWRADPRLPAWLATWVRAVEPTLVEAPPGERLDDRATVPPAPTAAELAALGRLAVGAVAPLAELQVAAPREAVAAAPHGHDDALWALLALLLLAVAERRARDV